MKTKKRLKIKNKKLLIVLSALLLLSILFLIYAINSKVVFKLVDGDNNTVLLNEEYNDPGIEAKYCVFSKCKDLKDGVKVSSNIKSNKVGSYTIKYSLKYNKKEYELEREIKVIDNISPTITLNGQNEVIVCPNKDYNEEGYKANDNYDGDITSSVKVTKSDDGITYSVSDSSDNKYEIIRKINHVDKENPKITLKGKNNISIAVNSTFKDPGYTASDNCDGDLTQKVKTEGSVDTAKVGKYKITYSVEDQSKNKVTVTRNITVYQPQPTSSNSNNNESLDTYLKNSGYNVSVIYYNIGTGYTYKYNASKVYYGASLIKTLDAMYVYEKMDLTTELKELVKPTIEKSNNSTHKKLVNKIGINNLRNYGKSLGASNVLTGSNLDYYGNTTANDQLIYMKHLWKVVNNNKNGAELKSYFINDYFNNLLFSGSPKIMHKYGYYGAYYHDVGIVLDSKPYIIVVLTQEANHNYKSIVQNISKKVYEVHKSL